MDGRSCIWLSESDETARSEGKETSYCAGKCQARKHKCRQEKLQRDEGVKEHMLNGDRWEVNA